MYVCGVLLCKCACYVIWIFKYNDDDDDDAAPVVRCVALPCVCIVTQKLEARRLRLVRFRRGWLRELWVVHTQFMRKGGGWVVLRGCGISTHTTTQAHTGSTAIHLGVCVRAIWRNMRAYIFVCARAGARTREVFMYFAIHALARKTGALFPRRERAHM